MSEIETQLREKMAENSVTLGKACTALDELINRYHWDYKPDAEKAFKYGRTVNASQKCDRESMLSWQYIEDYELIMWFINVARDYCYLALEDMNKEAF